LHDEASMLGSAEMAGVKKVAKNMLAMNIDIKTITKATGLTEQEISALRK
jgi:predicted transposase YdaD